MRVEVLDATCGACPCAVGEVAVAGAGIAQGYLNRPDLTAERFVPDLYGPAGERTTGPADLGRLRADGTLALVGTPPTTRKSAGRAWSWATWRLRCSRTAGVAEGAVVAGPTRRRRPAGRRRSWPPAMRSAVGRGTASVRGARLPDGWCPSAWVALDRLPAHAGRQAGRRALPRSAAGDDADADVPLSPLETWVAAAWSELLDRDGGRPRPRLLRPGGTLAAGGPFVARVRGPRRRVPLRAVYDERTVAGVARRIQAATLAGPDGRAEDGRTGGQRAGGAPGRGP